MQRVRVTDNNIVLLLMLVTVNVAMYLGLYVLTHLILIKIHQK